MPLHSFSEHAQTAHRPHSWILYDRNMNISEVLKHCGGEGDDEEAEDEEEEEGWENSSGERGGRQGFKLKRSYSELLCACVSCSSVISCHLVRDPSHRKPPPSELISCQQAPSLHQRWATMTAHTLQVFTQSKHCSSSFHTLAACREMVHWYIQLHIARTNRPIDSTESMRHEAIICWHNVRS